MNAPQAVSRHILLVDDDPLVVKVYAECMRFEGWTVAVARDGWEAGQEARRTAFDVILLDIRMPHQDGWSVLREMRRGGPNQETPVYILTSLSVDGLLRDALSMGADGVFLKSEVRPDELVERINAEMSGSPVITTEEGATEPSPPSPAPQAAPAPPPAPEPEPPLESPQPAPKERTGPVAAPLPSARSRRDFVVYVNPFLGDGTELSAALALTEPFTCPVCRGQICLKIRFDDEGTGLAGGFECSRCQAGV